MGRQAVLLIHGIGEQRPMASLREFIDAVWVRNTTAHRPGPNADAYWSKPYTLSQDFELRRYTTGENRAGDRTDFFEFYWAHLMHGTTIAHLAAWAAALLLRRPARVPQGLRGAWWLLWLLLVLAAGVAGGVGVLAAHGHALPAWAALAFDLLVVRTAFRVLRDYVGDAARYLHVAPQNVQRRHAIRSAGLRVLKSLHAQGYDRIVVVGHSLGSVIGYDILAHAWAAWHAEDTGEGAKNFAVTEALEHLAAEREREGRFDLDEFRAGQAACFDELRGNGSRWCVSDFVTLGSPLAHAAVLLADDHADLQRRFGQRELPTCPPTLEAPGRFTYTDANRRKLLHQAALFAPTRWTNLYFRADRIGGPLAPLFGPGIVDVRLPGRLGHTDYWSPGPHLETLQKLIVIWRSPPCGPPPLSERSAARRSS